MNKFLCDKECQTCDHGHLEVFDMRNDLKSVKDVSYSTSPSTEQNQDYEIRAKKFFIWSSLNTVIGFFTVFG
jgi:hypothetical protein